MATTQRKIATALAIGDVFPMVEDGRAIKVEVLSLPEKHNDSPKESLAWVEFDAYVFDRGTRTQREVTLWADEHVRVSRKPGSVLF